MSEVPQFGEKIETYADRPGSYAIVFNEEGKLLTVSVRGMLHLPGGGIDPEEDPMVAVAREVLEEAGYEIGGMQEIGKANQFLPYASIGPLNKLGTFYTAVLLGGDLSHSPEDDHVVTWVSVADFLDSNASEYQKWAVKKALHREE